MNRSLREAQRASWIMEALLCGGLIVCALSVAFSYQHSHAAQPQPCKEVSR